MPVRQGRTRACRAAAQEGALQGRISSETLVQQRLCRGAAQGSFFLSIRPPIRGSRTRGETARQCDLGVTLVSISTLPAFAEGRMPGRGLAPRKGGAVRCSDKFDKFTSRCSKLQPARPPLVSAVPKRNEWHDLSALTLEGS